MALVLFASGVPTRGRVLRRNRQHFEVEIVPARAVAGLFQR
jgi:hypothetical protein